MALRRTLPSLSVTYDAQSGQPRTLSNHGGYLTPADGRHPLDIAMSFVQSGDALLGLEPSDVTEYTVTDVVPNRTTGSTHVYMRQSLGGVPVYNAQLQININRDGRIISMSNQFVRGLARAIGEDRPRVGAARAVAGAAAHLNQPLSQAPQVTSVESDVVRTTTVGVGVSRAPIKATLMYLPILPGDVRLVWNFQLLTVDDQHAYDFTVDATSGQIWTRFDWVAGDAYRVFPARPRATESPSVSTPPAPADGRVLMTGPSHAVASPFGWHDWDGVPGAEFQTMRGGNAHAYADGGNINLPPDIEPVCGAGMACDFGLDLQAEPSTYTNAAIANLFYWNNVLHDVQYQYGFTEAAGNFQFSTYGRGGFGADEVQAEAQDGLYVFNRVNNANFLTPPDGYRPRMQVYTWTYTAPRRDGSLDAGLIAHEYGHGISNRLVGGPSNVSCLANLQQPGEGISDWLALVYTARADDLGPKGRGIATYLLGQPPDGRGLRTQRYSTDPAVNTWTYASIGSLSVPHGVGSVWAQVAWEMYWALVDAHGFDANLYDASGPAGNQRAMVYMTEAMMNAPCSPTFVDMRDGILQAALDNHGGSDYCRVWRSFAAFGLGADAVSGGPDSLTPIEGFGVPGACAAAGAPTITVNNVTVSESTGVASFTVFLSAPTNVPVTVQYVTMDGTAHSSQTSSPYDYVATSGSVVIQPSAFSRPIDVPLENDTEIEGRETFTVTLTASLNAPLGSTAGTATIVDDDSAVVPVPNPLGDLLYDYGLGGVWLHTDPLGVGSAGWAPLHGANPLSMVVANLDGNDLGDLVIDFPAAGLWVWQNNATWRHLHPFNASELSVADLDGNGLDEIVAGFPGFGIYALFNDTVWARILSLSPQGLTAGNLDRDSGQRDELVINFPGMGVWEWTNNAFWVQIHSANVSAMKAADIDGNGTDDLVLSFPNQGLWTRKNDGAEWIQMHYANTSGAGIGVGDIDGDVGGKADVIINFTGFGVWAFMNGVGWVPVHPRDVSSILTTDLDGNGRDDVVLSFPGAGVWAFVNNTSWIQLLTNNPEALAAGRIDSR